LSLSEGIPMEEVELPGLGGVPTFGLDAPPALIVLLANIGAFGDRPDMVVAGINPGPNTGRACLHSGTVGAALTGSNVGITSLAVSVGVGDEILWDTPATFAVGAVAWLASAPPKTLVNLNVPNLPLEEVRGVRSATLAPFGTVRTAITGSSAGRLLVLAGYATVTTLVGIRAVDEPDAAPALERLIAGSGAASSS
jgi:5'-nucleotidase